MPTLLDMGYLSTLNDNLTQGVGDEFPAAFDLREQGAVTPVRNQGSWGNCWAFAAFGSLESWIGKSEGTQLDLSENHLINRHGWSQGFGKGGSAHMASGYLLRWAGPVAEGDDAYPRPGESAEGTPLRHVQRVRWIPGRTACRDLDGIKSALMAYGALQTEYYHSAGYWNAKTTSYRFDVAVPGRPTNHSVDLIGWDDAYPKSNFDPPAPGNGAFLVRNSWGSNWGNDGYFWVSYYDESFAWKALYSFSNAEPADNYDGLYQHDPLGMVGSIGYGNATAWGANVFTATNASKVAAAGFYAMTPRTTYTLFVYTGCTPKAPRSGKLAAKQSGTIDLAGYVTVPLESPVAVAAGERFSLVLHLTTPGHGYPLATEYAVAGYSGTATARPGESFLSPNGNTWSDFTDSVASTANFCCKAYVKAQAAAKTLVSLAIGGVNTLEAGASAAFSCTAAYSDGSSKPVAPAWSIAEGGEWAEIDAAGTVRALATDEQRQVTVRADYEEGGVAADATWKFFVTVAAPAAPADLEASRGTEESCVRLAWSASAGASGYAVYRGTKESSGHAGYLGTVTVPRYADASAVPGVDYWYFVKAKNASGSSAFSEGVWGWRALAAPTGLTATDGTLEDAVELSWNGSEGASHHRVWRAEEIDGDYAPLSDWQTACRFADGTAEAGKTYFYAVTAALDAEGTRESAFSVPDDGFRTGPVVLDALEIAGPVSLASGERGTYTCAALYTDGSRKPVAPRWVLEGGTLSIENRNAVAEAPVTGETATMTLRAEYTDGETRGGSLEITVVPVVPAAPEGLVLVSADEEGIALRWNAVADATSYQLWRSSADEAAAIVAATTETAFTDKTAVPGVAYAYRVAAANGAGAGEPGTDGVTATRPIAAPTGVSASYGTHADKVVVDWQASEGAAFYRVWRAESVDGEKMALCGWQADLSFEDMEAAPGTLYYYYVTAAADDAGATESAFGAPATGLRKVSPKPVSLAILGPDRVPADSTAAYTAKAQYDNGVLAVVVPAWRIEEGGDCATIEADGILSVGQLDSDCTLVLAATFTDGTTVETSLAVTLVAPRVKTASITALSVKPRWPWNGLVDVDYTLATAPSSTVAKVMLSGYDLDHQASLAATTLSGDGARGATVEAGEHRITWNVGADYPGFHASQVRISLNAVPSEQVEPGPVDGSLSEGLVAWYAFDGNAKDSSGNGNDGTVEGATPTADRNGKPNGAYSFDGNDMIVVADSESLRSPTNAVSIAVWLKPGTALNLSRIWEVACCKGMDARQYGLGIERNARVMLNDACGVTNLEISCRNCGPVLTAGVWRQIVVTWDGTVFKTYRDGILLAQIEKSGILPENTESLYIGADYPGGDEFYNGDMDDLAIWNRALTAEEVARLAAGEETVPETGKHRYEIVPWTNGWAAAKADAEARGGHLATITSVSEWNEICRLFSIQELLGCWLGGRKSDGEWQWVTGEKWDYTNWRSGQPDNLNGTQDCLWLHVDYNGKWDDIEGDIRGGGKYLLEYDGTVDPPVGKLSDGLVAYWPFDGDAKDASGNGNNGTASGATLTAGYDGTANGAYHFDGDDMIVVPDSASLRSPTDAGSIAVWFKPDSDPDLARIWVIACCKGMDTRQYGLGIERNNRIMLNDKCGVAQVEISCRNCGPVLVADEWHQIVITWDGETFKTYRDGLTFASVAASGSMLANTEDFYIGADYPGGDDFYSGDMDDLAIWNRALTAEEVALLYAGEKPLEKKKSYEIVPWTNGWHAAKADAESRGGHLATITSEEEWETLSGLFGNDLIGCWLGGTDEEEEGVWKWVTGEPWDYARWRYDQPDNLHSGQNYLWLHVEYNGKWDDIEGDEPTVTKYLLEREDIVATAGNAD